MPASALLLAANAGIRIASLDLCADEYLLMFADRNQVASVSRVVADRADSPLWRVAQGIPLNRGRIEDLIRVRPTHLLMSGGSGRAAAQIAKTLGIQPIALPFPSTIAEVSANVAAIAAVTGRHHAARRWKNRLESLVDSQPLLIDSAFVGQGGLTVSPTSLSARWMKLAGYRQRSVPGGRLSFEYLLTDTPPVLLTSNYRRAQSSRGQQWLNHPLMQKTPAKRVSTDGRPWTCAGPLMVYEVARLRGLK